jgi:hypothetical protein
MLFSWIIVQILGPGFSVLFLQLELTTVLLNNLVATGSLKYRPTQNRLRILECVRQNILTINLRVLGYFNTCGSNAGNNTR